MKQIVKKKIVVVGGGTGTHTVLKGLKKYKSELDITAVVTMADSGGSSGRLRDEFGQLPVGDARMALVALATDDDSQGDLLRELFLYRFAKGEGLSGHNFGNLLLTALTDILGDSGLAIESASQILRVSGKVLPVTLDNVHLRTEYQNGEVVVGEHHFDNVSKHLKNQRVVDLSLVPKAKINPSVRISLEEADVIVFGPGDLYPSIFANCVVNGFREALKKSSAKIVYVSNLMSRHGQSVGMKLSDYIDEFHTYTGFYPNHVLFNTTQYPEDLLSKYIEEGNHPVENDCADTSFGVYGADLVATEAVKNISGDTVKRSLIRHDSDKLAKEILHLI